MTIYMVKILAAWGILLVAVLGGIAPILAARFDSSRRFLGLGNALAGGIFLGVGLLHLLPEASEALSELYDYPVAPLLAALGVALLLLIDRVLFEENRTNQMRAKSASRQPIYPLVLLIALSVHSVIAGIALGLQPEIEGSLLVMFGILLHKGSAAFALMVNAQSSGTSDAKLYAILAVFALMTPAGILFGMATGEWTHGPSALLFQGSLTALAAGTFIYVAIMESIDSEMSRFDDRLNRFVASALAGGRDVPMPVRDTDRMLKFVLVTLGITSMALFAAWE